MKIECPECHSFYQINDSKIPDKGIYGSCKKCGNKIFIQKETDAEIILEDIPEQNPISDKCPECSQNRQPNETHCSNCGIKYEKYQEYSEKIKAANSSNKHINAPITTAKIAKLRQRWLYIVGFCMVGAYAAMFIPAFLGHSIESGGGSMLWTGLFFYLWWKLRARKGWHGAMIGFALGFLIFMLAAVVSGFMSHTAGG